MSKSSSVEEGPNRQTDPRPSCHRVRISFGNPPNKSARLLSAGTVRKNVLSPSLNDPPNSDASNSIDELNVPLRTKYCARAKISAAWELRQRHLWLWRQFASGFIDLLVLWPRCLIVRAWWNRPDYPWNSSPPFVPGEAGHHNVRNKLSFLLFD